MRKGLEYFSSLLLVWAVTTVALAEAIPLHQGQSGAACAGVLDRPPSLSESLSLSPNLDVDPDFANMFRKASGLASAHNDPGIESWKLDRSRVPMSLIGIKQDLASPIQLGLVIQLSNRAESNEYDWKKMNTFIDFETIEAVLAQLCATDDNFKNLSAADFSITGDFRGSTYAGQFSFGATTYSSYAIVHSRRPGALNMNRAQILMNNLNHSPFNEKQ